MWSSENNQAWSMPMQASAYQNISHDQIDWATLAQQWIQMKEVQSSVTPSSTNSTLQSTSAYYAGRGINGGEAPMEVVKDEDQDDCTSSSQDSSSLSSVQAQRQGYYPPMPLTAIPSRPPPPTTFPAFSGPNLHTPPPTPTNFSSYQGPPLAQNFPKFNTSSVPPTNFAPFPASNLQTPPPTQWTPAYPSHLPRSFVPSQGARPSAPSQNDSVLFLQNAAAGLDANKRKQLPLWIREGLERMERQKHKKEEREMLLQAREDKRKQEIEAENQLRLQAQKDGIILPPSKSKFESDSDDDAQSDKGNLPSSEEDEPPVVSRLKSTPVKSRTPTPVPNVSQMTPEEILQQLMLKVRRVMTEVLLEVTGEEIQSLARAVYRKAKSAAPAKVIQPSQALTLGLGEYGSDSEDDDKANGGGRGSDTESDGELQVRIEIRKNDYTAQSDRREAAAAIAERRFERWEKRLRGETFLSSEEELEVESKPLILKEVESSHSTSRNLHSVGAKKDIQVEPEANHIRNDSSKGGFVRRRKSKRDSTSSTSRSCSRSPSSRRRERRSSGRKASRSKSRDRKQSKRSKTRSRERKRSKSRRSSDRKSKSRRSRSSERRSRSRDRRRSRR